MSKQSLAICVARHVVLYISGYQERSKVLTQGMPLSSKIKLPLLPDG